MNADLFRGTLVRLTHEDLKPLGKSNPSGMATANFPACLIGTRPAFLGQISGKMDRERIRDNREISALPFA